MSEPDQELIGGTINLRIGIFQKEDREATAEKGLIVRAEQREQDRKN